MSRSVEAALAECLERLEAGELTREDALSLYPELRSELEPLLDLSIELRSIPRIEAPASLRAHKRPLFRAPAPREAWWRRVLPTVGPPLRWASPLAQAAAVLALVLVGTGTTVVASASSLPDEPLYPVKLAIESVQIALTPGEEERANLEMQLASKRLEEVEEAAKQGRGEAVARGAELYAQALDSAVKAAESAPPSDAQDIEESLRRNVEVLNRLQQRVTNERAQTAIGSAIERSLDVSNLTKSKVSKDKGRNEQRGGNPTSQAATAPTDIAATPTEASGHEPSGKANGRRDEPAGSGEQDTPRGGPGGEDERGPKSRGAAVETATPSPERTAPAAPVRTATAVPGRTATPTLRQSAAPAPEPSQVRGAGKPPTARPSAEPTSRGQEADQDRDAGRQNGVGQRKEKPKDAEAGKKDILGDLVDRLRQLMRR